ncbi:MAG: DUF721 domain-containing protein [Phycisphaerales bacterium]|nr:DUF721 domain-containing protein [Phycisphaerales bacterium]
MAEPSFKTLKPQLARQAQQLEKQISFKIPRSRYLPKPLDYFVKRCYSQCVGQSADVLSAIADTWQSALPKMLLNDVRPVTVTRGVLHILAASSSAADALDRRLRDDLLPRLKLASKGRIFRAKVTVDRTLGWSGR